MSSMSPPPPPTRTKSTFGRKRVRRMLEREREREEARHRLRRSSSPPSYTLFERIIYHLDVGQLTEQLMLAEGKAELLVCNMMPEERALADCGSGVVLVIQDEDGRRFRVMWRRRRRGSSTFVFCGRGWGRFAEVHQLWAGDVLQFLGRHDAPREFTGKLCLGVRVVEVDGGASRRRKDETKWPPWPKAGDGMTNPVALDGKDTAVSCLPPANDSGSAGPITSGQQPTQKKNRVHPYACWFVPSRS